MAATPPASWELATPVFGIRYPKPTAPAQYLPDAFNHIGTDLEAALVADGATPPTLNYRTGTKAERLAAAPTRDLVWVETDTGASYIGTGTAWLPMSRGGAGTSATRDAVYGVPATDPARVALANQLPMWWNTESGWLESYYTRGGLAGLTVPGLIGGASTGWYPVGLGPRITLYPNTSFAAGQGVALKNWNGTTVRRGGASWLTYDNATGVVSVLKAGRYRLSLRTAAGTGSVLYDLWLSVSGLTDFRRGDQQNTNFWRTAETSGTVSMPGGNSVVATLSGVSPAGSTVTFHAGGDNNGGRGELTVEYLGPALITE